MNTSRHISHEPQSLVDLRNAVDSAKQLAALRKIKNELTGHRTRKAEYIRYGIITVLIGLLADHAKGTRFEGQRPSTMDLVCGLVANILCILAHEGPGFVHPILDSHAIHAILQRLILTSSVRLQLALFRCLNAIADNLPPHRPGQWLPDKRLSSLLYSRQYVRVFPTTVRQTTDSNESQQLCDAALALICKTSSQQWQKKALVEAGMLGVLASRLGSFIVTEGLVCPSVESVSRDSMLDHPMPEPAPSNAHLSPVLETIAILVEGSKDHAQQFLADPAMTVALPLANVDFSPADIRKAPWGVTYFLGSAVPRSKPQSYLDLLLPNVPMVEKSNSVVQSSFPPLSSIGAMPKRRTSFMPAMNETGSQAFTLDEPNDIEESSIVPWLLYVVRESKGKRRFLALKLLVTLFNLRFVRKARADTFAALVVPLLIRMLDKEPERAQRVSVATGAELSNGNNYFGAVPAVLANLILDAPEFQKVAVDLKAITKLANGLKSTFDAPFGHQTSPWRPRKQEIQDDSDLPLECRVSDDVPTRQMRSDMAYREGTLQALSAIAPFNDEYRKVILEHGVLAQIMLALEPFQVVPNGCLAGKASKLTSGNSAATILAACGAVRMLTRSVTALRTKLVDAEVAAAVLKLMNSADPEVRIAATKVLTNLALDYSPMKSSVGEEMMVKKLCEQAHSANARLRLESIWALKQLVVNAPKKLKQDIVDELGVNWIKLLIKTDPYDIPDGEVIGLVDRDYPPRRVSPMTRGERDHSADVVMSDGIDSRRSAASSANNSPVQSDEIEEDFNKHTVEDDTAVQEQLLDLIRNLLCGENASDLASYIVHEMGQDDFFAILLARLKPRMSVGVTRRDNQTLPIPVAILKKALYILVHLAACNHKWRNVVVAQTAVLKQILAYFNYPDREVRALFCWIVINLTYEDDATDRPHCKSRAIELQKLGYLSHLKKLESDPDLDVRERAKTAVHLMTTLLTA